MSSFQEFLNGFFTAIKTDDFDSLNRIYTDWLESSGMVPEEQKPQFVSLVIGDLKPLAELEIDRCEEIGEFDIAHMKSNDGDISLMFRKKGDSWVFFNEKSNFTKFQQVYALGYSVQGGKLRVLFNGKRTPAADSIENSGFNSLINSVLKAGENEITLESIDGSELAVSLMISSGKADEIISSGQGNVLDWKGTVKEPLSLKFTAE